MNNDDREIKREDRLLRRASTYRGIRLAVVFLWLMSFVGYYYALASEPANEQAAQTLIHMLWLWLAVGVYAQAKLEHIVTIRRYRAQLGSF